MKCDVCGYDCGVVQKEIGVQLKIGPDATEHERVKEMFGQTEFVLCWCCYLKSMGINPQQEQE